MTDLEALLFAGWRKWDRAPLIGRPSLWTVQAELIRERHGDDWLDQSVDWTQTRGELVDAMKERG